MADESDIKDSDIKNIINILEKKQKSEEKKEETKLDEKEIKQLIGVIQKIHGELSPTVTTPPPPVTTPPPPPPPPTMIEKIKDKVKDAYKQKFVKANDPDHKITDIDYFLNNIQYSSVSSVNPKNPA